MEKPKILIVDDLEENLISMEMLLNDFEVDIVRAASGQEALRHTIKDEFAMVILDVQMPGMDGYETLSLMRKRKKTKYLPVIFVSAIHQSDLHIIKGIETGAVDFIPKPIIPEILIGKVKIFLDLYQQQNELNVTLKRLEQKNTELEIAKEKAIEATKTKTMFLANMSHEIRTPMNGIMGISKILNKTSLTEEQAELMEIIINSGENLLQIINDILDYSKIESNQVQLEKREFELRAVVKTIVKLFRFKAREKGLNLTKEIAPEIPNVLVDDSMRLTQILTNLVNNGIKFTASGSVAIIIELVEKKNSEVELLFKVKDTGIGIDKEGLQKLFKEFSQTDSSITRKYGGTGLGLAICKNLVNLMEGEIGVDSAPGHGSVFWFGIKFPYHDQPILKKEEILKEVPGNLRILVAEDNPINQRVAQLTLKQMGLQCDLAQDGQEAVKMHQKNPYQLILMDMQMPNLDGIDATKLIRSMEDNLIRQVYIVAVTANAFSEDKQRCLEAGMNDFISKPFKEAELRSIFSGLNGKYKNN